MVRREDGGVRKENKMFSLLKYRFQKNIKWPLQRAKKGYSDVDLWNIKDWFMENISKMLIELSTRNMGYPGTDDYPTDESWKADLKKYGMMAQEISEFDFWDEEGEYHPEKQEEYEKLKRDFFDWFVKNFEDLWD